MCSRAVARALVAIALTATGLAAPKTADAASLNR
jgi:hypothetical protein